MFQQRGDPYNMMHYNEYSTSDMAHYPGPSQLQSGYNAQMAQQGYPLAYGMPMGTHPSMYGHMQMPVGSTYVVPNRGTYVQQQQQEGRSLLAGVTAGSEHAQTAVSLPDTFDFVEGVSDGTAQDKSIDSLFEGLELNAVESP